MKVRSYVRVSALQATAACACGVAGCRMERAHRAVWLGSRGPFKEQCAIDHLRRERRRCHNDHTRAIRYVAELLGLPLPFTPRSLGEIVGTFQGRPVALRVGRWHRKAV